METIKQYLKNPLIAAGLGLVVGLFVGWFIIGWGLWPVQWVDGELSDLREDIQIKTMRQIVDAYSVNKDAELALSSYSNFGEDAELIYGKMKATGAVNEANLTAFETILGAQGLPTGSVPAEEMPENTEAEALPETAAENPVVTEVETVDKKSNAATIGILLGVLLAIFLVGIAIFAYIFFIKGNKKQGHSTERRRPQTEVEDFDEEQASVSTPREVITEAPRAPKDDTIKQFLTEYVYGNDLYDDTFSIDAASGEFLGECGVGILDTVGNTEPKSITAFEVWLFDKNDVQTVTKVLMTDYAMHDINIRQRLEVKGEPVGILSGMKVVLETATLQLEGRVLAVEYGPGTAQDANVIQRLQIEMTVRSKEALA